MIEKPFNSDLPPRFSLENIEVDTLNNTITTDMKECSVEPRLIRIITRLAQSNGNIVSRTELFKEISEHTIVSDESLTQAVSKIRQILEDDPKRPRFIKTVPKKGYELLVPAVPISNNFSNLPEVQPNMSEVDNGKHRLLEGGNRKQVLLGLLLVVLLVLISIAFWPEQETIFIEKGEIEFIEKEH